MHTLREIAVLLNCPPPADELTPIAGVGSIDRATSAEISYISSDGMIRALAGCKAAAIIASKRVKLPPTWTRPVLWVDDAELAIARVLRLFAPPAPRPPVGVDSFARVEESAALGAGVAVGPFVYIGRHAKIGARCVIHPGVYIGDESILGEECELFPNVTVRERITLGDRVIIHSGSAIGSDGFGYRWDGSQHVKIPQIGTVIIEDDVEIGSSVCIDRAKFGATRIGRGAKIDNLVQIAHNCDVGPHCIITGQVGLAGSVKLGAGVVIGGQSSIRDGVSIGDGAMIAGASGVADDIPPREIYSGIPAMPHRQNLREQKALRRLPNIQEQIRALQEEITELKKK